MKTVIYGIAAIWLLVGFAVGIMELVELMLWTGSVVP